MRVAKRTILMISPSFHPVVGGLETHLNDLCEYLRERGYRVYVITYRYLGWEAKIIEKGNPTIYRIPWFSYNMLLKLEKYPSLYFIYLGPVLLLTSLLFMLMHKREIDVIHAHGMIVAAISKVLKKIFKKRTVVSLHTIYGLNKNSELAKKVCSILPSFDRVLTLSNRSKVELLNAGLSEDKITVFTYWINQNTFRLMRKDFCKRKLNLEGKFVILFVGRLIKVKGVTLLLKIANKLKNNTTIHFAFVGTGPLEDDVRRASKDVGNISFFGKVDNRQLSIYYNAADVLVVPSYIQEEGCGRVILESLSCGTPVIASNIGGIPEIINSSVGILIEPKVEIIEETILKLYHNRGELKTISKNCRKYAEKRFSERNAQLIEESYW